MTCPKKCALFVSGLFCGARSGKKIGKKLFIVLPNAGVTRRNPRKIKFHQHVAF
jgi:hypothetical protein